MNTSYFFFKILNNEMLRQDFSKRFRQLPPKKQKSTTFVQLAGNVTGLV